MSHSPAQILADRGPDQVKRFMRKLEANERKAIPHLWTFWGRPEQQYPKDEDPPIWLLCTGRGWGKNRTGSEWVHQQADELPGSHGALIARTAADARDTMVQGISGILATMKPWNPVDYIPSLRLLRWKNGTTAHTYSSEAPDLLRGPNHHWAFCDEWATWTKTKAADGGTAWDHVLLSTRLEMNDTPPRIVVTTTPRPTKAMRELVADPLTHITTGSLLDNVDNLSPRYRDVIMKKYEGTRLGRQEIEGKVLYDLEGAFLTLDTINKFRVAELPKQIVRVVVAVDPSGGGGDAQGIVAVAKGKDGHAYVFEDKTCNKPPAQWGRQAADLYFDSDADLLLGEGNYGGDMVENTVRATLTSEEHVKYRKVTASRGKHIRAEPVCALYEKGFVHHVGVFTDLEDQLCAFTPEGFEGDASPNNADAGVFAVTELLLGKRSEPRIR